VKPDPRTFSRLADTLVELVSELRKLDGSSETGLQLLSESSKCPSVDTKKTESIDATEFASILNVHPRTLRRWAELGKVPKPICVGRTLRWRRSIVDLWMKEGAR